MKTAIIIPARYASQRLPGKPLLRETGKYLIQHVYERAYQAYRAQRVIVATDDPRIESAVRSFGGDVVMTSSEHPSGTDRVAEVAEKLDAEIIINLQGDEPLVEVDALNLLATLIEQDPTAEMATLAVPIRSMEQWLDPSCVKVVRDKHGRALYFSRSPIPHVRDGQPDFLADPPQCLLHLGLYAFRREFLLQLAKQPPEPLEQLEKLEQLRVLASGHSIRLGVIEEAAFGIDTPEDYQRFVGLCRQQELRRAA